MNGTVGSEEPANGPASYLAEDHSLMTDGSWVVSEEQVEKWTILFKKLDTNADSFISQMEAGEVFVRSGLGMDDLEKIWRLVDNQNKGQLDMQQFVVAMFLITKRLTGGPIPLCIPRNVQLSAKSKSLKEVSNNNNNNYNSNDIISQIAANSEKNKIANKEINIEKNNSRNYSREKNEELQNKPQIDVFADLKDFLQKCNLGHLIDKFVEERITMEALKVLTEDEIKNELGLKLGERKILLNALKQL